MRGRNLLNRFRGLDPLYWTREVLLVLGRALSRMWGRDVMLYVGGVSFFAMLAVFPALSLLVGVYTFLLTPEAAAQQADSFAYLLPPGAQDLFRSELTRLAHAPVEATSTQSVIALIIGGYAAHRGFKAMLAGLAFIHDEEDPRGFFRFNLLALLVLLAAIAMMTVLSGVFLTFRVVGATLDWTPLEGVTWIYSEWTWVSVGLTFGMSMIYRYAMSANRVGWRAAITGGAAAAAMFVGASWASAFYVDQIAHLGAMYGSLAAIIVALIWLSWNVNAIFFGGALATEVEIALGDAPRRLLRRLETEELKTASPPES
ncbi:YihY/virulence factor BrkB family protein [Caulobacter sp. NIBR2454]|uniref:YihY/virulence factor BrkB family protein n=1 Tax=Caulobacter sp. NIBR2454 TaxID=3015996 RepID=UPI0022B62E68|nr:YihY/virulence factor BrkB family protein [Caulobacter sp. NIBR2454]